MAALRPETHARTRKAAIIESTIERLVLDPPLPSSPLPDWVLASFAREMWRDQSVASTLRGLLGVAFRILRKSAERRVSAPPALAVLYAIFVHPLRLAGKVVARAAKRRTR